MRTRVALAASISLLLVGALAARAAAASPVVLLFPSFGPPTTSVLTNGTGFGPSETVVVTFDAQQVGTAQTNSSGAFSTRITVPKTARPGAHMVRAIGQTSHLSGQASFTVRTDWTRFRFDQNHTGVQPFENILNTANVPMLQLDWQAQLGKIVNYSSPAVVNGVVYIGSSDGRLWAYPANGCGQDICTVPLWRSTHLAQIIDAPTVALGRVYVGSQTSDTSNDGKLNVFNANGCGGSVCAPLWQGLAGPDSILQSSPAVTAGTAGARVYVGSFDGKMYVFNANGCGAPTCQPLWTGATGDHIESSPTVSGSTVYIGSNDGKLYAFNANGCGAPTCQPLWTGNTGETIFDSSPAVANGIVYIGSVHHLSAFRATGCGMPTCQPLWQGSHQQDFVDGSPAVFGGRVYIGLENEVGVFNANGCGQQNCGPLWINFGTGTQAAVLASPTIANGVVYVGKMNGEVLAWKAAGCGQFICNQIWSYMTKHPIVNSSPTVVNGIVYIGGANSLAPESTAGRLYVFALP
jgi:outer membrane protein assembly factor BamB